MTRCEYRPTKKGCVHTGAPQKKSKKNSSSLQSVFNPGFTVGSYITSITPPPAPPLKHFSFWRLPGYKGSGLLYTVALIFNLVCASYLSVDTQFFSWYHYRLWYYNLSSTRFLTEKDEENIYVPSAEFPPYTAYWDQHKYQHGAARTSQRVRTSVPIYHKLLNKSPLPRPVSPAPLTAQPILH